MTLRARLAGLRRRLDAFRGAEALMGMDERAWARHANPWSVWTRIPILPLAVALLYARRELGMLVVPPLVLLAVWVFLNPRVFPAPERMDSWAARGVTGERLFLDRRARARRGAGLPRGQLRALRMLTLISVLGLVPLGYGLIVFDPWATLFGLTLALGAKLWFVDRCAFLADEARRRSGPGRVTPPGL